MTGPSSTAEHPFPAAPGDSAGGNLAAAGVRAAVRRYPGMIHGFFDMGAVSSAAAAAIAESCAQLGDLIRR